MNTLAKDNFLVERKLQEFISVWNKIFQLSSEMDVPRIIKDIQNYEKLDKNEQRLIILFSAKNFEILYWGRNFESLFGYTDMELSDWNIRFFFKSIIWSHIDFPMDMLNWGKQLATNHWQEEKKTNNPMSSYCGLKVRHKAGHVLRLFIRQLPISFVCNRKDLSILFVEEVSHLLKGEFYWGRFTIGKQQEHTRFFRSAGTKKEFKDIVTPREAAILQLIAQGKESKEVAEHLSISIKTVETHRRNMIARSGAKDTTALIQLCKMCQVF